MILHGNPNNWSCLPAAFAMVIGRTPEWMIKEIGHDGSDEPYAETGLKAGFHEQECIEVLQRLGYACTPIEIGPMISPHHDMRDARRIYFGSDLSANWVRLLRHLKGTRGVLTGIYTKLNNPTKVTGHAVAWDGVEIHDPIGPRIYPLEDAHKYGFTPRCFWKVQDVKVHG